MILNLLFKLSYLNSNFELTLGYLNQTLNNSALVKSVRETAPKSLFSVPTCVPGLEYAP